MASKWIAALATLLFRVVTPMPRSVTVLGLALCQSIRAQKAPVVLAPVGTTDCLEGLVDIATLAGCEAAAIEAGLSLWKGPEYELEWPSGCYHCDDSIPGDCTGVWFNLAVGSANNQAAPICTVPGWEENFVSKYMIPSVMILVFGRSAWSCHPLSF